MPRKDGMKPIHILVTEESRRRINTYAEKRGFRVTADYIRHLIMEDMRAHDEEIDLDVDRGGYRARVGPEYVSRN